MPEPAQVLVIDDDPQILRLFKRILLDGGHSVVTATSGQKALDLIREHPFRVIVLDISMPRPDGFEVLKALRTAPNRPRILAVSGFTGELLDAAEFLGADAKLSKVDAPDLLLERVNALLR